ncbi:hypothetical protein HY745_11855 [Candidatus Desantisbacteria bacterium]|nr:hypothetical protein [Candidatus Desantisbacteria bacterium]
MILTNKKNRNNFIVLSVTISALFFMTVFSEAEDKKSNLKTLLPAFALPDKKKDTGLDLTNVKMRTGAEEGAPNVHSFLGCDFCHSKVPEKGFDKKQNPELIKLDTESAICETCHVRECLHSSELDPLTLTPPMDVPVNLPLGTGGKSKGKVTCMTCHYIHGDTFLNQLIRGFAMNNTDTKITYSRRLDFCLACHSKDEGGSSNKGAIWKAHKGYKENKYCDVCHKTANVEELNKIREIKTKKERDQKTLASLRATIKSLCVYCHVDQAGQQHFRVVNVFADKNIKVNLEELGLPLLEGKFTCVTCHDTHGVSEQNAHYLRSAYLQVATMSSRVNPHRRKDFCLSCHTRYDERGKVAGGLKFNNDINKVCTWCHDGTQARSDVHPINVVLKESEYMKKPQELILTADGKLTCYTCHYTGYGECEKDSVHAKKAQDLTNVTHLRGHPFENRWDECYLCHVKKEFKKFNAHYQLDSTTGKIIEESCIFCHASRPEIEISGMEKPKFKGVLIFLCLGCHPDSPHPGRTVDGKGVNHMVKPIEVPGKLKIPEGLPRSDKERLHCGSCHNPHAKGVIKTLMGKGAGAKERRRFEKCTDCHISK